MNDDMIARVIEMLLELQPGTEAGLALQLEKRLRAEFAGERVYVKKAKPTDEEIIARLNGRNVNEVVNDLGVSRDRVYRAIRRRQEQIRDLKVVAFLAETRQAK